MARELARHEPPAVSWGLRTGSRFASGSSHGDASMRPRGFTGPREPRFAPLPCRTVSLDIGKQGIGAGMLGRRQIATAGSLRP